MEIEKVRNIRKKIGTIASFALPIFLFFIVLLEMVFRFTGTSFYFFDTRYDVVLTDSMSEKNENHLDFLAGHDDQIQAFDLVVSKKIKKDTELNVYDIVLFDNPDIGTDMHRIVDIDEVGEEAVLSNLSKETLYGEDVIAFDIGSSIVWDDAFIFNEFTLVTLSSSPYNDDFYFNINHSSITPMVRISLEGDHYRNTISFKRDSSSPASFSITKKSYSMENKILSLDIDDQNGAIHLDASSLLKNESEQSIVYNPVQKYQIRGDKAKTDDGWFNREELISKVVRVHSKLGYAARFLGSFYGAILMVGLAIICFLYMWLRDREKAKGGQK